MSSVTDSDIYSGVKAEVKKKFGQVYNCSDSIYVIAISRKGPRQLESIFGYGSNEDSHFNILTELALPYFFNSLKNFSIKPSSLYLYDDAVYYGTTMESVYNELMEYMDNYGLHLEIRPYTGVLTAEAKKDLNLHIDAAASDVRMGFGNYYIRRLTEDIRSLRLPFEIEFPIIYYKVDGADFYNSDYRKQLQESLEMQYGESKVYEVNYYNEKEYNITILLNSDEDLTTINKIRIYPSADGELAVTCISPYILPSSKDFLQDAYRGTIFQKIWGIVFKHSHFLNETFSEGTERNRCKSLVSFYSYLNSYQEFLNRKSGFVKSLCEVFGESNVKFKGFKEKDLFYLFGDAEMSNEICQDLEDIYSSYDTSRISPRRIQLYPSFSVFEMPDFPTGEERQRLEFKNMETIKRCDTIQQALSVLFFNQTSLVEKWSRRHTRFDQKRLRFGQTFESIYQNVKILNGLGNRKTTIKAINKWVDRRIDQGCVVPQYVRSYNDSKWYRVFRPGENEDAVLSHLSRVALLVFSEIKRLLGRSDIENFALEYLLSIPFIRDIDINAFSDAIGIPLQVIGGKLYFKDDDAKNYTPLVDYLFKTGVIEDNEKMVIVSKTLGDDDLAEVTTLDKSVEDTFRNYIVTIIRDMSKVDPRLYYTIFNFYAYNPTTSTLARHESDINMFANNCDDTLVEIEKSLRQNVHMSPMNIFNSLIRDYTTIRSLQINEEFWLIHPERLSELSSNEQIQERVSIIQQKLVQLRGVYELIIYSFVYTDYSSLMLRFSLFFETSEKKGRLFEGLREIKNTLSDESHFNSNVWDRHTVLSYRHFINNYIKYQTQ